MYKFQKSLSTLREFSLRATISKKSLTHLAINLSECINSLQYKSFFSLVSTKSKELKFNLKDLEKLERILTSVYANLIANLDYKTLLKIGNMRAALRKIHRSSVKQPFCAAGINSLAVSSDGTFYLCHRFTEDSDAKIGNIKEGLDFRKLRDISNYRTVGHKSCQSCWMQTLCGGGCFHEHKMGSGNFKEIDPLFCKLQEIELKLALSIYINTECS